MYPPQPLSGTHWEMFYHVSLHHKPSQTRLICELAGPAGWLPLGVSLRLQTDGLLGLEPSEGSTGPGVQDGLLMLMGTVWEPTGAVGRSSYLQYLWRGLLPAG